MNRRRNFWSPRRTAAAFAIVLALAFAASSITLPARAGGEGPNPTLIARPAPQHLVAVHTGTVYPLELPPATPTLEHHGRPLRRADLVAYQMHKDALAAGSS